MKQIKGKKSESQYISWILLLAMTLFLSYLLYTWSLKQAQDVSDQLEKSTDPLVCESLGFTIESICQNSRTLNFNVTNSNNLEINGFIIKSAGLYPEDTNYLDTKTIRIKVSPGDTEKVKLLKLVTLSQVEITPFTTKNRKDIYCEAQSIKKEKKDLKQC